jgi:putative phosphoribosyl transferase
MSSRVQEVIVTAGVAELGAFLAVPETALAVVLFAHGSGSSRHSRRNQFVARVLNDAGFATLLVDLLTPEEERIDDRTAELCFDIGFLAQRLIGCSHWLQKQPATAHLPLGYFGASTGAAAALVAAAAFPQVAAVVSRGGRPDLAAEHLARVQAATLLIVGGNDDVVIDLNRQAFRELRSVKQLEIVPGATHLFPEPGTLEQVAELARDWFTQYLPKAKAA